MYKNLNTTSQIGIVGGVKVGAHDAMVATEAVTRLPELGSAHRTN